MSFRTVPKRTVQRRLPESLIEELDLRALRERKLPNLLLAEVVCRGLGVDPARHGIVSDRPGVMSSAN